MKAMIITNFGDSNVFEERDVEKPEPGDHELLVKVHATSVNPVDYKIRKNGSWAGIEPPAVIGADVAGVVERVGSAVTDFEPGCEVFYSPEVFGGHGSYAEYHVVDESIIDFKPKNISFEEAAALPLAGCTAWDSLINTAQLLLGETILIHAGSGGVGSLAIQIAKAAGAKVFTTCGKYNFDLVKSLGADVAIDYHEEDFVDVINKETDGKGVDLVYDTVGGETISKSLEITRPYGRIVSIVNTTGNLQAAYHKNITVFFYFLERSNQKMNALKELVDRNQLKAVVDSILPLTKVAEAHDKLEKGHGVKGKIVLKVN